MKKTYKHGDLVVWHIPQIPGKAFEVQVKNIQEAKFLLDALAGYDKFQFENRIKGDYASAGGLKVWDDTLEDIGEGKFTDWADKDGNDVDNVEDLATAVWEMEEYAPTA